MGRIFYGMKVYPQRNKQNLMTNSFWLPSDHAHLQFCYIVLHIILDFKSWMG